MVIWCSCTACLAGKPELCVSKNDPSEGEHYVDSDGVLQLPEH